MRDQPTSNRECGTTNDHAHWLRRLVRRTMIWLAWKLGYILTPTSALETWTIESHEWETVAKQYTHDEFMSGQASGRAEMLRRHVMYHKIWALRPPNVPN